MCKKYVSYIGLNVEGNPHHIVGIERKPGYVHKFIDYNIYEGQITKVPINFKKEDIESGILEKFYCGEIVPLKKPVNNKIYSSEGGTVYFTGTDHLNDYIQLIALDTEAKTVDVYIIDNTHSISKEKYSDNIRDDEWMFTSNIDSEELESLDDFLEITVEKQKSIVVYRPKDHDFIEDIVVIRYDSNKSEYVIPKKEKLIKLHYFNKKLYIETSKTLLNTFDSLVVDKSVISKTDLTNSNFGSYNFIQDSNNLIN